MPTKFVRSVAMAVGLNSNCGNLKYLPDMTFYISGFPFTLNPKDYVAILNNNEELLEAETFLSSDGRVDLD